ncbi:glycosyltransferase [Leuconostoc citreum]
MQAIFLNTFYAANLSGASYAVNKRLELFLNHHVHTNIMTTVFNLTNRFYFEKHFPDQKDYFFDFINILTDTINIVEKAIIPNQAFFNSLNLSMHKDESKAVGNGSTYATWTTYPDGRLLEVSYYSQNNTLLRKDGYDYRGFLCLKSYYKINQRNELCLTRQEHLNEKGDVLLVYYFFLNQSIRKILWFQKDCSIMSYDNENDLLLDGLAAYTKDQSEDYMVIADLFESAKIAKLSQLYSRPNVKIFIQLHNIQYKETPDKTPLRIGYSYAILNNDKYGGLITLTSRQKQDINYIAKDKKSVYSVPENWYSKSDLNAYYGINWENKEDGLVIISARLESVKQIDHAIKAIVTAHNRVPKIHLEIWGSGSQQNQLSELIKSYQAEDYIFLKGTLNNTNMKKRLSEAQLHLLTSKNEGLPMVLFEAQLGQTPSICYDIDYGPDAIITNRINGDLIAPNDIKYLAMRIEELFKDEKQGTLRQYSFNTHSTIDKYSESNVWSLWENLIERTFKYENNNRREG